MRARLFPLKSSGVSMHEIARRLGTARSTVRETLKRLSTSGLSWAVAEGLSEAELEAALYAGRGSKRGHRLRAEPDWPAIHSELKRKQSCYYRLGRVHRPSGRVQLLAPSCRTGSEREGQRRVGYQTFVKASSNARLLRSRAVHGANLKVPLSVAFG